jgi:hypothetical protein
MRPFVWGLNSIIHPEVREQLEIRHMTCMEYGDEWCLLRMVIQ